MMQEETRVGLVCDFNAANLGALLSKVPGRPRLLCQAAPYDQVIPTLLGQNPSFWDHRPQALLVWSRPSTASAAFGRLLECRAAEPADLISQVDAYCDLLRGVPDSVAAILVPAWSMPPLHQSLGIADMKPPQGSSWALMEMNRRLTENVRDDPRIYVLDSQRWLAGAGEPAFNPKLWYLSKTPFSNGVFRQAAADVQAGLASLRGGARKLLVLDLDDTLWGGIVGDVGWEKLRLGGHDPLGEAFLDFQRALKILTRRGILLAIVSKNEEETALQAIASHPEMALRLDDFAAWRINWDDKARNIAELVEELNLGIDSAVFIDDNLVERARVREALPEMLVPEWPSDPMLFTASLASLRCFDSPLLSREDRDRTRMYVSERKRRQTRSQISSLDDWLKTLQIEVGVEELGPSNLQRAAQLFNKTNQMNLSTRRLTESELMQWHSRPFHRMWVFHVSDKFGSSGLTGIASLAEEKGRGRLCDFILSCRVMGRRIEEAMLSKVALEARRAGLSEIWAQFVPTAKNQPCRRFLEQSVLEDRGGAVFGRRLDDDFPLPEAIRLIETSPVDRQVGAAS